ncbi:hypothetical protein [Plebeiibacterium sediminum]|uniref:DNA replication protein DnaC n=1 Tax=Plebeiibacterium sediminum TaxID=2992112 RepID=A0AAE3SDA6_9BACT|nr:hypothetical protein [Plebeiobacterium sediminum]MCW3784905.1 hypothetical protein [Plebeiobacterium sediminum]
MKAGDIQLGLERLKQAHINPVRKAKKFSFGDFKYCRQILYQSFISTDGTVQKLEWLPEYDKVAEWMVDNQGKGLCMVGDCGRGKSSILTGVLPLIFNIKFNKNVHVYPAEEMPEKIQEILTRPIIAIDELGVEPMLNNYGEKYEAFNRIINLAEKEMRLLFITTNLTKDQILQRYDIRTWERINRLCKVVRFEGESYRR